MVSRRERGSADTARKAAASVELELKRSPEAPGVARAAVSGLCHERDLSPSLCHTLLLLVSEVVTNAVLHSNGPAEAPILLTATVASDGIRVAVTDAGRGFTPGAQARRGDGHGLYLLDKSATRWGIDRAGGTRVWFELAGGR
jgi:anti-sigma regulatory factor (Ser/Thr protein kinase)